METIHKGKGWVLQAESRLCEPSGKCKLYREERHQGRDRYKRREIRRLDMALGRSRDLFKGLEWAGGKSRPYSEAQKRMPGARTLRFPFTERWEDSVGEYTGLVPSDPGDSAPDSNASRRLLHSTIFSFNLAISYS